MEMATWDRRRFPRWRAWGWLSGWINDVLKVSVANVSRSGALIEHPSVMRPGSLCLLTLSLRGQKVSLKCRVVRSSVYRYEVWSTAESNFIYRTGLELVGVEEASQRLIGGHLAFLEAEAIRYQSRGPVLA
jgi:hypothetical protein